MPDVPFTLKRLDHVVLRTRAPERLLAFYQSLGCSVVREVASMRMVQLSAGSSMIDIIGADDGAVSGQQEGRNMDHFAIRIEPFDEAAILAFCQASDIEATAMPTPLLGADGYGPAVYLQDPDGNRVELKGPPVVSD